MAVIAATLVVCLLVPGGLTPVMATICDTGTGEDDDWRPPSKVEAVSYTHLTLPTILRV